MADYLLNEDGTYLLQEDGSRILLEQQILPKPVIIDNKRHQPEIKIKVKRF